jgi:hypothetical protein
MGRYLAAALQSLIAQIAERYSRVSLQWHLSEQFLDRQSIYI